jgi:hypothetical protein
MRLIRPSLVLLACLLSPLRADDSLPPPAFILPEGTYYITVTDLESVPALQGNAHYNRLFVRLTKPVDFPDQWYWAETLVENQDGRLRVLQAFRLNLARAVIIQGSGDPWPKP